jgi:hypothetical protein
MVAGCQKASDGECVSDQQTIVVALRRAVRIYLEPGQRDAEETINQTASRFGLSGLAAALERLDDGRRLAD